MRAEYDSQVNALSIDLVNVEHWDTQDNVDDDYCNVAITDGRPVNIELLDPANHLELLGRAAERYELDAEALRVAAGAALAAPDRIVDVAVHARSAA